MTDWDDRRLYVFAPLPASVNRFVNLSEDLAPAWKARTLVAMPRRHVTLLDLSIEGQPLSRMIRLARRCIADALPEAFRMNVDTLAVSERAALLVPSEEVIGARQFQARLLHSAKERGCELPRHISAPRPHVTLGYGYEAALPTMRIDGISWQVDEVRLVLSHRGETLHEELDRWRLPTRESLAA